MPLAGIYSGLNISASGMRAQRIRQNAISSNLANGETTRTAEGGPYRRQFVVFEADSNQRDVRILNQQPSLQGAMTDENHLPIPPSDFPRDERFFGQGVRVGKYVRIHVRRKWSTIRHIPMPTKKGMWRCRISISSRK